MKVYSCDISKISESTFNEWLSSVGMRKKEYVMRLKKDNDKKRTVTGEILARKGISDMLNIPFEEITFKEDLKGKPSAENLDVFFNISHSGDFVVCAIREKSDIGIDIEEIRPFNPAILKRICSSKEADYIMRGGTNINISTMKRFFEVWTAKEAIVKLSGDGISGGLSYINVIENGKIKTNGLILEQINIDPNYICTVAYK